MAAGINKLKIKNDRSMSQLVNLYAKVEQSANRDPNNRGGSNDLWSELESAVGRYSQQTGEKFDKVLNKVKKTYSDRTKQGRGSSGPTGMTPRRFED